VERVRRYYARYGAVTVLIARNIAGIRFPTFLMAGVSKMGCGRFFFWDGLSGLVSVPLWFWLGYAASENWEAIYKRVSGWIFWGGGALLVSVLVWRSRHESLRLFGRRRPEDPSGGRLPPPEAPEAPA